MKWRNLNKDPKFYNSLIDQINVFANNIGIGNMSGVVKTVTIPANSEIEISHGLNVTPAYRIILRQSGPSALVDGDSPWNERTIYLKNTDGSADITATVLILRS